MRRCGAWGTCGVDTKSVKRKSVYPGGYSWRESLMYARVFITQSGAPRISGQCSPAIRTPFLLSYSFRNSRRAPLHRYSISKFPRRVTPRSQPQVWSRQNLPKGAPSAQSRATGATRNDPKDNSCRYSYDLPYISLLRLIFGISSNKSGESTSPLR